MANFTQLKESINQVIKENGNNEISGVVMQNVLNTIVSTLGQHKQYVGSAFPTTTPGTPDGNVFYLATTPGEYVNFNTSSGIVRLVDGEVCFLFNGSSGNWGKYVVMTLKQTDGFSTREAFSQKAVFDSINTVFNYVNSKPLVYTGIPVVRGFQQLFNFPLIQGHKYIFKVNPIGGVSFNVGGIDYNGNSEVFYGANQVDEVEVIPNKDYKCVYVYFGQGSAVSGSTIDFMIKTDFSIKGLANYTTKEEFENIFSSQNIKELVFSKTSGAIINNNGSIDSDKIEYIRTSVTNTGSSYMLNIDHKKEYLYTGKIDDSKYSGVAYYSESGNYIGSECKGDNEYNLFKITPPLTAKYAGFCGLGGFGIYENEKKIKQQLIPKEENVIYVDANISISGNGSLNNPYKTIREATDYLKTLNNGVIYISGGDYREVLDIGTLQTGIYKIRAKGNDRVRILGSDKINNWVKTPGYVNVYETNFNGSVVKWRRFDDPIFEDGNPSKEIEPRHYHPLQKNLKHRLPFTPIYLVSSIDILENTPGSYFIENGKMYIHTSKSDNPQTNGFSYENISRYFNTNINATTQTNKVEIHLDKIQFMYGYSFNAIGFYKMYRNFCVALGCSSAGAWRNDTGYIETWFEEAGFCDNDGENSHFASNKDYDKYTDNRTFSPTVVHNYLWTHDNGDDGESSHELHNIVMTNGLFEFNGDSGSRPSNDATYNVYNCLFRNNGWEVGTGLSNGGEGFSVVNPVSGNPNTVGCRAFLYNCISEENNIGYSTISSDTNYIELNNCITRNNKSAELHARQGTLVSRNTRGTNVDVNKLKVIQGTGVIKILNDEIIN